MPIHPDWKPIYDGIMEQYCDGTSDERSPRGGPCQKGEQVFYAYCAEHKIDHTKPRPRAEEAFSWIGFLSPEAREGRFFIRGRAIHPCKTYHPDEWPEVRVYLEEELEASAPTLSGKPLLLDHAVELGPPNIVVGAAWEGDAVEYVAEVGEDIYDLVKGGEIRHASVEYDWQILEKLDGVAPKGLMMTGLSLLRRLRPGDPSSSAEVWECVVNKLIEIRGLGPKTIDLNAREEDQALNVVSRLRADLGEAQKRIRDLLKERDAFMARLSLGEAIVQPMTPLRVPPGYVKAEEILAIVPREVPWRWGPGPHELVRRLRKKCIESQSTQDQPQGHQRAPR